MEVKLGIAVSPGIAIRRAFLLDAEDFSIAQRFIKPEEGPSEIARFEKALDLARKQIVGEQEKHIQAGRAEIAQIFRFHQLMLEDKSLKVEIVRRIQANRFTPEYAV